MNIFDNLPVFPVAMKEYQERDVKPHVEEFCWSEDVDLTLYYFNGRIFVYRVDDGFYLMPEWVSEENISNLFEIKESCESTGFDRGHELGRQEERRVVRFYAKLLNGVGDQDDA